MFVQEVPPAVWRDVGSAIDFFMGQSCSGSDSCVMRPGDPTEAANLVTRDELLTASDVAEILRVRRSTALDYMRRGVVPACKIGRRWYSLRGRLGEHLSCLFDGE